MTSKALKRATPEDDVDRLAERIWERGRDKIQSLDDYNGVFASYLTQNGQDLSFKQKRTLRLGVLDSLKKNQKGFAKKLKQEKEVQTKKEKEARRELIFEAGRTPTPGEFKHVGRIKNKTVFVRRTSMTVKDKLRVVYRDERGRFARFVDPKTGAVRVKKGFRSIRVVEGTTKAQVEKFKKARK